MALCLCFFVGCSSEPNGKDDFAEEEVYSVGYDQGYEDGIKYVLSALREGAYDWPIYMDIEDVDASIHDYMEAYHPDEDCCDVRDMIIYADYEHYTLDGLLDKLIAENIDEPTS